MASTRRTSRRRPLARRTPARPRSRRGARARRAAARGELRAIKIVWQRELIRFCRDRLRIVTSLVQPFLFLFVLGTGLSHLAAAGTHGVNLRTFVYPGVLCMAVHVHRHVLGRLDRVGPRVRLPARDDGRAGRRSSLVLGKCLGGATVAGFQGVIVLCLARRSSASPTRRR